MMADADGEGEEEEEGAGGAGRREEATWAEDELEAEEEERGMGGRRDATSLGSVARQAARASSMGRPAIFPPGLTQKSLE